MIAAGIGLVTRLVPDQMLRPSLDSINGFQTSPGGIKQFEKGRNGRRLGGGGEREKGKKTQYVLIIRQHNQCALKGVPVLCLVMLQAFVS